jgi:formylglycine-generating enzyme required for sulfatase activity
VLNRLAGALLLLSLALLLGSSETAAGQPKPPKPPYRNKDDALKLFAGEFVSITPGQGKFPASFRMGSADGPKSERPAHTVKLSKSFALAKYEVTQELYQAVMGKNPSKWQGPRNSVEMVSWEEAVEFCRKATAELRQRKLIGTDEVIRLPSEAEWEYACRAGTTTPYSFGTADIKEYCWFKGNSKGYDPPVGAKKPNPWGLYDMHGYIWEWCADGWHADYAGVPADGSAWDVKGAREHVIRGGSWNDPADSCHSAARATRAADFRSDTIGFRCVRSR